MLETKDRDYYTVAEVAEKLDVSPSTVWRWVAGKRLPAYRVGERKIRIKKDDLDKVNPPAREIPPAPAESPEGDVFVRPSAEALAQRQEVVARILASQKGRSIAPLTSADLIHQVRDEREERYRSWLKPSS